MRLVRLSPHYLNRQKQLGYLVFRPTQTALPDLLVHIKHSTSARSMGDNQPRFSEWRPYPTMNHELIRVALAYSCQQLRSPLVVRTARTPYHKRRPPVSQKRASRPELAANASGLGVSVGAPKLVERVEWRLPAANEKPGSDKAPARCDKTILLINNIQ